MGNNGRRNESCDVSTCQKSLVSVARIIESPNRKDVIENIETNFRRLH